MRVLCPACGAAYEVPDRLIGQGRRLRCAKCEHDWMVRPAAPPMPAPMPEPAPAPEAAPAGRAAPQRAPMIIDPPLPRLGDTPPGRALGLWLAWVASVLMVGGLLAGLWLFRLEVVAAWPPAARLFLALGAPLG
jgi:predicted Zn finger-like uncharacterized protein